MPGSTTARGYGWQHQKLRAQWAKAVERGAVVCRRCREPILPGQPWDLGHPDQTCPDPLAPECIPCNRATSKRERKAAREAAFSPRRSRRWVNATQVEPTHDRLVVVLCGPPGAGKTTAARESGLQVYDRDDPQWSTESQFTAALRALATNPSARAVVIRAGASSSARQRARLLVNATHVYVMTEGRDELARRISTRGRSDLRNGLASINTWLRRYDRRDNVPTFPGWSAVSGAATHRSRAW